MGRFFLLVLLAALALPRPIAAQEPKHGGILRVFHRDSPGSPSILEETSDSVTVPFMAVFNNLVLYKQDEQHNSNENIEPELASSWSWSADNTALTFKLREGVKWHDGKPFTSADVKCTWDLILGHSATPLRVSPRKDWYKNLKSVTPPRRLRGHLSAWAPATRAATAAGVRLFRDLSLPRFARRNAPASDWYRAL